MKYVLCFGIVAGILVIPPFLEAIKEVRKMD